jgi:RND family efflux transporter MFP subunit
MTLERDEPFDASTVLLLEVVAALAGPVLEGLRRDDRFVGAKVLDAGGETLRKLLGPRHVALKLVAGALALAVVFLALAKGDYRVTADAVLEPAVKRAASAPFDGYVAQAPARAGDLVSKGAVLARLDDRDLQLERVKWESELAKSLKQYRQALAERDAAEAQVLSAQVAEASAELDRIRDRLARTDLTAPFDGVVVTGDLSQKLGAPVKLGDVLFEVAPLDAYRIRLLVDESDIARVEVGQAGSLVLSSLPEESFRFVVQKITPVARAEEGKNTFRVEAALERVSERLRPGIEGVAKIEVGERRLLWIWTHDGTEWLRLKLWAWLP